MIKTNPFSQLYLSHVDGLRSVHMKVKDLIKKLQELDPESTVVDIGVAHKNGLPLPWVAIQPELHLVQKRHKLYTIKWTGYLYGKEIHKEF